MNDIVVRLRQAYHLDTVQPEHPIRQAVDEIVRLRERVSKLEDEAARMLTLARENGQLRDVARRERDRARLQLARMESHIIDGRYGDVARLRLELERYRWQDALRARFDEESA